MSRPKGRPKGSKNKNNAEEAPKFNYTLDLHAINDRLKELLETLQNEPNADFVFWNISMYAEIKGLATAACCVLDSVDLIARCVNEQE